MDTVADLGLTRPALIDDVSGALKLSADALCSLPLRARTPPAAALPGAVPPGCLVGRLRGHWYARRGAG